MANPKVAVVSEFYPSHADPVLGVWAHRQALAARAAGAEVQVLVLYRLVPPRSAFAAGPAAIASAAKSQLRQPRHEARDGLPITYVPFVSPPRARSYATWGAWAAPALALALRRLRRSFPFELIHAHNAVPAGDAVRRARLDLPLVVSVHGGDVLYTAPRLGGGHAAVVRGLQAAQLVLANSQGIAELARAHGARATRVVHLGADGAEAASHRSVPQTSAGRASQPELGALGLSGAHAPGLATVGLSGARPPELVTVGHLVARKRHADVIRALAVLSERHPTLRYVIVGEGPERAALEALATRLGVSERVELCGQIPPAEAIARARRCTLFVMPSTEEAFGVAYIEAMAGGIPAIGCRGEPGPEEIAMAGDGFVLVPPGDIERLSQRIDELLSDPDRLRETGRRARGTVAAHFTWEHCGEQTLDAYRHVICVVPAP